LSKIWINIKFLTKVKKGFRGFGRFWEGEVYSTEKIVEAYCNYVKGWATIPNLKCDRGQYEIDILAVDPKNNEKYHIECSVSISSAFSKLTAEEFSEEKFKKPVEKPRQRMTIGYFKERKFGKKEIMDKLAQYGFKPGNYYKVIVVDGWTDEAQEKAREYGIELWNFNEILYELVELCKKSTKYYEDDTLRATQLLLRALKRKSQRS